MLVPVAAKNPSGSGENLEGAQAQPPHPERGMGTQVRVSRSWWGGVKSAEIRLETPGWVLTAEDTSAVPWFSRGFVLSACMVVVSILVAFMASRTILRRTWGGAEAIHEAGSWSPRRPADGPSSRAYRGGAVDLNRSESAIAQSSFISEEEASARPIREGLMDRVAPEAEFLTEVSVPTDPMAAEAAHASLKPADIRRAEDQSETRALELV